SPPAGISPAKNDVADIPPTARFAAGNPPGWIFFNTQKNKWHVAYPCVNFQVGGPQTNVHFPDFAGTRFSGSRQKDREGAVARGVADTEMIRRQNRDLVLDALRRHGPLSRTEIAMRTGLSNASLTAIGSQLIAQD